MDPSSWRVEGFMATLAGASPHTRAAYQRDVGDFVAWAERGACAGPAALDRRVLRRYLALLDTRRLAPSSIARKASALRAYVRWLARQGVIAGDVGAGL